MTAQKGNLLPSPQGKGQLHGGETCSSPLRPAHESKPLEHCFGRGHGEDHRRYFNHSPLSRERSGLSEYT